MVATAFCSVLYVANFHPERLSHPIPLPSYFGEVPPKHRTIGGTPLGIAFGTAALLIFIFAALLNIRKRMRTRNIGHVQTWLRAHIWLTILTIPLIVLHSGFRLGGPMTTLLVLLYAIVMMSGFYGLALQQFIPRVMKDRLPHEVVYEEIPYLRAVLVKHAKQLRAELTPPPNKPAGRLKSESAVTAQVAAGIAPNRSAVSASAIASAPVPDAGDSSDNKLRDFLDLEALPYLRARRSRTHRLGSQSMSDDLFRLLKLNVSEKYWPNVDDVQTWCDSRRKMDLQQRLHAWLHSWLLIHAPLSFLLLILTVWHAVATIYFF